MSYFSKFQQQGIPFMEGAEKGDIRDIVDSEIHIVDFGFIKGDNGDFAVFQTKENEGVFFFAPNVISENLKIIDEDGKRALLAKTTVIVRSNTSKNKREYFTLEYCD